MLVNIFNIGTALLILSTVSKILPVLGTYRQSIFRQCQPPMLEQYWQNLANIELQKVIDAANCFNLFDQFYDGSACGLALS